MDVKRELKAYIEREFAARELGALRDDDPLIDLGVIDSTGIFRLMSHIEKDYGVRFSKAELKAETFQSVAALADLIERKRRQRR